MDAFADIVRQNTSDLPALMREAEDAVPQLDALLTALQDGFGCPQTVPARLKGTDRAEQKAAQDYDGKPDRLLDLLRGAVVVDSLEQVNAVRRYLDSHCDVVRKKDKFKTPLPHGHRDLTVNIRLPNGHIAELQVRLQEFHDIRHSTHGLYERLRSTEDSDLSEERKAERRMNIMRELHQLHGDAISRFNARTPGEKLPLPAMARPLPAAAPQRPAPR